MENPKITFFISYGGKSLKILSYFEDSLPFYLGAKLVFYYANVFKGSVYRLEVVSPKDTNDEDLKQKLDSNYYVKHGSFYDDIYSLETYFKKFIDGNVNFLNLENKYFVKYLEDYLDLGDLAPSSMISEISSNRGKFKQFLYENSVIFNITDNFDILFLCIDNKDINVLHPDFLRGMKAIMSLFSLEFT